ncbi:MAG: NUDIX hydrolase [Chloroflexi bacterium]|nr:NUDIX hydrolase [Chloroflexota bacterium]
MHKTIVLGLIRNADAILLVRQAYGYHLWTLPGGDVEPGESLVAALVREVHEETGFDVHVQGLVSMRNRADQTCLVFMAQVCERSMIAGAPGEIEAVKWFSHEEVERAGEAIEQLPRFVITHVFNHAVTLLGLKAWDGYTGPADLFI